VVTVPEVDPIVPEDKVNLLRCPNIAVHGEDSHDYQCADCGRWVTIGPSGVEYGHERGIGDNGPDPRCDRRPPQTDPVRTGPNHHEWNGSKSAINRGGSA
jgi:hypothetical protein